MSLLFGSNILESLVCRCKAMVVKKKQGKELTEEANSTQPFSNSLLTQEAIELLKETLQEIKATKRKCKKQIDSSCIDFTDRDLAEALSKKIPLSLFSEDKQ